ncbi:hypothetical protein IU485_16125 [Nocardia cyriacigeorgica]|uniref:hypothetical protein n=1 Tax=Nocardia cyriacigeorgica TaxID=135487 RepID=UPI0018947AAF|nr:hypothetical protein [Nocardia cyriacigeorgica]MBF6082892.1 hypothetical protein [Nocardia cyriacigeorgica]
MGKPTSPDEHTRTRQQRALELRLAGRNYDDIAAELDYASRASAWKAVQACLDRTEAETVADYRYVQDCRYTNLFRAWWPAALSGDDKAAAVVLRTLEALSKLHGLNRDTNTDNAASMSPAEFQQRLAEYVELATTAPASAALTTGGDTPTTLEENNQ